MGELLDVRFWMFVRDGLFAPMPFSALVGLPSGLLTRLLMLLLLLLPLLFSVRLCVDVLMRCGKGDPIFLWNGEDDGSGVEARDRRSKYSSLPLNGSAPSGSNRFEGAMKENLRPPGIFSPSPTFGYM